MSDFRSYNAPNLDLNALTTALTGWLRSQKFDGQVLGLSDGVQVQARQTEGWRKLSGASAAMNVTMRKLGDALNVEIGAGQWGDKAAAGAVGMFLLWPLAFTAAYGAWQQNKLPDRILAFIDQFIATGGQGMDVGTSFGRVGAPPPGTPAAPFAGASAPAAAPVAAQRACASCGTSLAADAAFCPKCGTKAA